jgi:hypothetical protein
MNADHRIRHRNDEGNILTSCALINDRIKEHPGHREKEKEEKRRSINANAEETALCPLRRK